ncbi:MAG: hypothetical protein K6E19_05740, partial [Lachnospiraceae bacterium]|nr:hypothetical protein [Lachnospiraceae bacterium]
MINVDNIRTSSTITSGSTEALLNDNIDFEYGVKKFYDVSQPKVKTGKAKRYRIAEANGYWFKAVDFSSAKRSSVEKVNG